jgi:hypothetical protein
MKVSEARRVAREALTIHRPSEKRAALDFVNGAVLGACAAAIVFGVAFAVYVDRANRGAVRERAECLGALVGATTPSGPWGK